MLLNVKRDGRYILLSVLLHSLVFLYFIPIGCGGGKGKAAQKSEASKEKGEKSKPGAKHEDAMEIVPKIIEVSLVERPAPSKEKGPQKPKPQPKPKHNSKDGYWGIGIYTSPFADQIVIYDGQIYSGMIVRGAIAGNPAAVAGIQRDDIIFMVDNMPISDKNEVKGSGPRAMILHVKRGESIFTVPIERGWIETRKGNSP